MSTIAELYRQSELALAAYSQLFSGITDDPYKSALQDVGMSPTQAERFAERWRVVAQYSHSEAVPLLDEFNQPTGEYVLRSNGLVVTLFEEAGTGRQAVAVRGTERGDAADWTTNVIDIGLLGTPERQAQYRSLVEKVGEWRGAGLLRDGFAVTGHSLGGFLASALAIEWAGRIAAAYVYNAPGLGGVTASEAVAERVWRALSPAVVEGSKTRNSRFGKSQSARHGGQKAANDRGWRIAA